MQYFCYASSSIFKKILCTWQKNAENNFFVLVHLRVFFIFNQNLMSDLNDLWHLVSKTNIVFNNWADLDGAPAISNRKLFSVFCAFDWKSPKNIKFSNSMTKKYLYHGHRRRRAVSFRLCLTQEWEWEWWRTLSEPEPVTGPWVYTEAVYLLPL